MKFGQATSGMQDLIFAAQSRRTIERWQAAHADRTNFALSLVRLDISIKLTRLPAKRSTSRGLLSSDGSPPATRPADR